VKNTKAWSKSLVVLAFSAIHFVVNVLEVY